MSRPENQDRRLTIGQYLIAIAVCALGLSAPETFVLVLALILGATLSLGAIFTRSGRRIAEWCAVAVMVYILFAMFQPAVATRCRRGGRAAVTRPVAQRPRPAAPTSGQPQGDLGGPGR